MTGRALESSICRKTAAVNSLICVNIKKWILTDDVGYISYMSQVDKMRT